MSVSTPCHDDKKMLPIVKNLDGARGGTLQGRTEVSIPEGAVPPSWPCWEGVALGWKEEPPGCLGRPRSRGGDLPLPPSCNKGMLVDDPMPSLSSVKSDSGLNSLEYWDYSVELECLSGPEGKCLKERLEDSEFRNNPKVQ